MGFGLRVGVLLLLLVAGTLSQGDLFDLFDLFDALDDDGADQPQGFDLFDLFDLSDALDDVPATPAKPKEVPKASEKPKTDGFNLDDALRPAVKPTVNPSGGDCQGTMVQKLNAVMENQKQQLRLLQQLTARYLALTGPCAKCGHTGRHLPEELDDHTLLNMPDH